MASAVRHQGMNRDMRDNPDISPHRIERPVVTQRWEEVTMLHWRVAADALQARLPQGVAVDTADGSAWVSLVPFRIADATVAPLPPPPLSTFPETNVRTYVTGAHGPGIWFFSLDVPRLLVPPLARLSIGEPYNWSRMRLSRRDAEVQYLTRRRLPPSRGATSRLRVRIGAPSADDDLDRWLTNRWGAYSQTPLGLTYIPVRHQPWRRHDVEILELHDELGAAVGLPVGAIERAHYSAAAEDVRFTWPRRA